MKVYKMAIPYPASISDALAVIVDVLIHWEVGARSTARHNAEVLAERIGGHRRAEAKGHMRRRVRLADWLFVREMETILRPMDEALLDISEHFSEQVWEQEAREVFQLAPFNGMQWPPAVPANVDELVTLIAGAIICDLWHAPLAPEEKSLPLARLVAHDRAEERLEIFDKFNSDDTPGFLIPAKIVGTSGDILNRTPIGISSRYLFYTAYLPPILLATDADGKVCALRNIQTNYRSSKGSAPASGLPVPSQWRIAVAPMAEAGADVDLVPSADRKSYSMCLSYDVARIEKVVEKAINGRVHLLFTPEMSIRAIDVPALISTIQDKRKAFKRKHNELPELRYVILGVLEDAPSTGEMHRNYAVVIDAEGNEVARQEKLAHWNFSRSQRDRFGITFHHGEDLAEPLIENSQPALELEVVDLPTVGRLVTLICADIDQDDPGDWLMANLGLDWLNFPIMDKSVCWERSVSQGFGPPWIVPRAHRACLASAARVVVTNSISLTCWVNSQNLRDKASFGVLDHAGIGLFLDPHGASVKQLHLTVGVSDLDCLALADWKPADWDDFPAPPY